MENFFSRYKNPLVLMAVLFIQVIALATQVKARGTNSDGPPLIRVWTVTAITPFERAFVGTGHFFRDTWRNYVDLRHARRQNHDLQEEIGRLRLENARMKSDVDQNRRLQSLLDFKEKYVGQTVAAQVIGSGGSEQSHVIYIDKHKGLKPDMAVITADGIVGKIKEVYPDSSLVLLINDRESGAGVVLENSRLQGVLRGGDLGELRLTDIMSDEKVDVGERVITSGGDRIYPKGLPVGTVSSVGQDSEGPFLAVRVKPAASLDRLEEVLVVTKMAETIPAAADDEQPRRAADILAQRLPSVPKTPSPEAKTPATAGLNTATAKNAGAAKPAVSPSPGAIAQKVAPGPSLVATPAVSPAGAPKKQPEALPAKKKNVQSAPAAAGATENDNSKQPAPTPQPAGNQPEKPPR